MNRNDGLSDLEDYSQRDNPLGPAPTNQSHYMMIKEADEFFNALNTRNTKRAIELLHTGKANIRSKDTRDAYSMPLHKAAGNGMLEMVNALLKYADRQDGGAKEIIHAQDEDRWTPLHYAARGGHDEIVELLTQKGANVMASDNDQQTPLHVAARWGHSDVCVTLIDEGATDSKAFNGYTPLDKAIMMNQD